MSDWCIHLANIFYLGSFVNRDMMVLRILTCVGLSFGVIFFTTCETPMYGPTAWHVVFLLINFYQIYRLVLSRRETNLTPKKEVMAHAALEDFSREDLVNLLARDMNGTVDRRLDPEKSTEVELEESELILKNIVIERLSRSELINLIARRMWSSVKRRFKRRERNDEIENPILRARVDMLDDFESVKVPVAKPE